MTESAIWSQLERAVGGDVSAQDEIVRAVYPKVRAIVHAQLQHDFRRRHRWMLAAFSTGDVTQDVLSGVVRSMETTEFDSEEGFIRYLATVVRHRITDAIRHYEAGRRDNRRNQAQEADEESARPELADEGDSSPQTNAALLEQVRVVQDTMQLFGTRERALLELRLLEELQFPDIAKELGFSDAKAARREFLRAHARLLVELQERGVRDSLG